jgi:pimeloyl-ACP methyl ester carboxylesterase
VPVTTVSSGIDIAHETFGKPDDPAVLLVMGLGAQMIAWGDELCHRLAERGRYVVRYDNRDCGLSTKFDDRPTDLDALLAGAAPYSLADMAADGVNLLSALGIPRAHVVGSSMGGRIAQTMALDFPSHVRTLTSIMSNTGEPAYGRSTPEAQRVLLAPRPTDREGYIAAAERDLVWSSRRYADPAALRDQAARAYDRAYYPAGAPRQLAAMILGGSLAGRLPTLTVPTLVIHGLDDTLIQPDGGRRTAELIPGATLLLIPDMGHDRPRPLWDTLCDAIAAHTR